MAAKIQHYFRMLVSPSIPGLHPLVQLCEMFRVRHHSRVLLLPPPEHPAM